MTQIFIQGSHAYCSHCHELTSGLIPSEELEALQESHNSALGGVMHILKLIELSGNEGDLIKLENIAKKPKVVWQIGLTT